MTTTLPILHFNDVYRVHQSGSQGTISADQFAAKIASIRTVKWGEKSRALSFQDHLHTEKQHTTAGEQCRSNFPLRGLTLFSGDALNPSIESSVTRGAHMVEILNAMSIDAACIGNHDFDFGFPHLCKMIRQCNFPWMLSNIADVSSSDKPYDDQPQTGDKVVEETLPYWIGHMSNGVRVGCIGLVEKEWIATVPSFPPSFRYRSMVSVAKNTSRLLRDPQGPHRCDIIVALSHCRLPNDIDLANDLGATKDSLEDEHGVDLVLGGHDHTYYVGNGIDEFEGKEWRTSMLGQEKDKSCLLIKSGTDFHDLSEIELELSEPNDKAIRRRRIIKASVTRHSTLPSDPTLPELKSHIDDLMERVNQATGEPVAFSLTSLDCRMDQVRAAESPVGNLIADILLHSYDEVLQERSQRGEFGSRRDTTQRQVDMAIICGGSLRGDEMFGPGLITLRDILTIMPFEDSVIVRLLKGSDILEALENAVGAYPSLEGRFPQIAGLAVQWDSRKPPKQRLVDVRLLEDVHLFAPDGSPQPHTASASPNGDMYGKPASQGAETYFFERHDGGGYSIEVNKPKIRKGAKLDPDKVYRVCTREYMADGHDGFAALTRAQGEDIIDHENGSLMSTQVRKFLLGASLIWRLKSFRDSSDESGKGIVGSGEALPGDLLSIKTRRAVRRAHALSCREHNISHDKQYLPEETLTPQKPVTGGTEPSRRVVVDSSPGGIRDAIHVGASEHHSHHDAVSKHFYNSRIRRTKEDTILCPGDDSLDSLDVNGKSDNQLDLSSSAGSITKDSFPASSPRLSSSIMQEHIEISAQDGESLRKSANNLAIIAPLRDGRLRDINLI